MGIQRNGKTTTTQNPSNSKWKIKLKYEWCDATDLPNAETATAENENGK